MQRWPLPLRLLFAIGIPVSLHAQEGAKPAPDLLGKRVAYTEEGNQCDFPALCSDATGTLWTAFVSWDKQQDHLKLARLEGDKQSVTCDVAGPGIIHQPGIAADGLGALWVIWSQVDERNIMNLQARRIRDGKPVGDSIVLASSNGPNTFAQAGTDRAG